MIFRDRIKAFRRVPARVLKANPKNWREHPEAQRLALRGVLDEVGFADAVLARELPDNSLMLIDGHLRVEELGDAEIPVLILDVTEAEADKLLATLDPLAAMAQANAAALDELLAGVETGSDGLQALLDSLESDAPLAPGLTDRDDVPPAPDEPITKPGDLWLLGEHRLLCGDSTNPADVDRLMDGKKAALVATDPPYLVDYTGERPDKAGGNKGGKDWSHVYHEVDIPDADKFFRGVFGNVVRIIAPHGAIYCWHAHKRQADIDRVWQDLGILNHQQIIWVKPVAVFGRCFWHQRHEPCLMGWVKGSMPEFARDQGLEHGTVWEVDWEGKSRVVGNEHPTQKPVELFALPIRRHTKRGDVCFEPFSGSGSQLIAAEQEGRRCYAIELEPRFVDVAVARWERYTGKKAERISAAG